MIDLGYIFIVYGGDILDVNAYSIQYIELIAMFMSVWCGYNDLRFDGVDFEFICFLDEYTLIGGRIRECLLVIRCIECRCKSPHSCLT